MNTMQITQATFDDLEPLSLAFDAYRVFYQKPSDISATRIFLAERLTNHDAIIYLALNPDKTIAGFTQLYPSFSSTRMQRLWILNDLYVYPKYRGLGISKALINRAKELAQETNACGILLETAKTNEIGNQLYPSTGFSLEDSTNFYFWTKP